MVYYYASILRSFKNLTAYSLVEGKNMDRTSNIDGYSAIDFD